MQFVTPAAKRRLFFTPMRSAKRPRVQSRTATRTFSTINRRTTRGPRRTGTLTQQVRSLQRVVRNLAPEIKYLDTSIVITDITSSGNVTHLTAVAQGDTQSTRTGNTINLSTLHWQIVVRNSTATSLSSLRYAIVIDKEQVGDTSPAVTDVFSSTDPVVALPSLENLERFRILYMSPLIELGRVQRATGVIATYPQFSKFTWKGNVKVSYNGAASSDIEKNGVYMIVMTDDSSNTIDFEGVCRIGYTDV